MDEKKCVFSGGGGVGGTRTSGSKVSQIATIFQSTPPSPAPDLILGGQKPTSPKSDRKVDLLKESATQVTVVRTQSHISRFHNARALFEKLGNEEARTGVIKPGEKVKSLNDLRSRSSSANSSLGDESSSKVVKHNSSRSPSPTGRTSSVTSARTNGFSNDEKQNGFHPSTTPISSSHHATQKSSSVPSLISPSAVKHFQSDQERATATTTGGKSVLNGSSSNNSKPEKPERKFNSRELIEKQKNWTAHFSKTKPAAPSMIGTGTITSGSTTPVRYNSDPIHFKPFASGTGTASGTLTPDGGSAPEKSGGPITFVRQSPTKILPPAIPLKPNLPISGNISTSSKPFLSKLSSPSMCPKTTIGSSTIVPGEKGSLPSDLKRGLDLKTVSSTSATTVLGSVSSNENGVHLNTVNANRSSTTTEPKPPTLDGNHAKKVGSLETGSSAVLSNSSTSCLSTTPSISSPTISSSLSSSTDRTVFSVSSSSISSVPTSSSESSSTPTPSIVSSSISNTSSPKPVLSQSLNLSSSSPMSSNHASTKTGSSSKENQFSNNDLSGTSRVRSKEPNISDFSSSSLVDSTLTDLKATTCDSSRNSESGATQNSRPNSSKANSDLVRSARTTAGSSGDVNNGVSTTSSVSTRKSSDDGDLVNGGASFSCSSSSIPLCHLSTENKTESSTTCVTTTSSNNLVCTKYEDSSYGAEQLKSPELVTPDDSPNKSVISSSPGRLSDVEANSRQYDDTELTFSERTQTLKRKKSHQTSQVPYNLPPDDSPANQKFKFYSESSECDSGVFHFESSPPPDHTANESLSSLEGPHLANDDDDPIKPQINFNLCDSSHASPASRCPPPPPVPLSGSSVSEEDSGFVSHEQSKRELDQGLLNAAEDVAYADDDSDEDGKLCRAKPEEVTQEGVPMTKTTSATTEQLMSSSLASSKVPDLINISYKPDVTHSEPLMTPDEADHMLSSRILAKRTIRSHDSSLLSDEEAQEVVRLLSPVPTTATTTTTITTSPTSAEEDENGRPFVPSIVLDSPPKSDLSPRNEKISSDEAFGSLSNRAESNATLDSDYGGQLGGSTTLEDSLSHLGSTNTLEDSKYDSSTLGDSRYGSVSGSESGIISSVGSLDELDRVSSSRDSVTLQNEDEDDDEEEENEDTTYTEFVPEPTLEIFEESGVHYYEDGNFWMEVPGLPDRDSEPSDLEDDIPVKSNTKVQFSSAPIKVYSTFSMNEYDRRNEDVDPVAASAEYELEKRVEKLLLINVELMKGPEGLGLSIIGMGVGADAGLEKLGIFVKTITENGAAARDGRIQVNDQIIEVDNKSLVGVTQAYAASVLRNTCGLVKFLIGREKDPVNSEVAQLIRQSLQADRERDEQRRHMERYSSTNSIAAGDAAGLNSLNSSVNDSLASSVHSNADSLKQLLRESEAKMEKAQNEMKTLQTRLEELEESGANKEEYAEKLRQSGLKLREVERNLFAARKEAATYQDMLEQSQGQYMQLEKKYNKAKKLIREFHQREADLIHREEFYQQLLQEKDIEYNALVKALKDRVIQIEQELLDTQKKAGYPMRLPFDTTSLKLSTPPVSKMPTAPPVRPLLESLGAEFSDAEESFEELNKSSTVERKIPVKEELDEAVPQHELLDSSVNRSKAELAARGRQLPSSVKKTSSGSLNSSSEGNSLNDSFDTSGDEDEVADLENDGGATSSNSAETDRKLYIEYLEQQNSLQASPDPWIYQTKAAATASTRSNISGPPASLAEQLKQVLAERERRFSNSETSSSMESSLTSLNLAEEVKQAVNEANAKVKRSAVLWVPPPVASSPSSLSSGDSGDVWNPPNPQDNYSSGFLSSKKEASHHWQNMPVPEWSKEQVCQWLLALNLEQYIAKFHEQNINGMSLMQLESRDFKALGINGDDKNRLKRKLKDLKVLVEKEKRNHEKEKKEKEKLLKKAEKLAEKASKRK